MVGETTPWGVVIGAVQRDGDRPEAVADALGVLNNWGGPPHEH